MNRPELIHTAAWPTRPAPPAPELPAVSRTLASLARARRLVQLIIEELNRRQGGHNAHNTRLPGNRL